LYSFVEKAEFQGNTGLFLLAQEVKEVK
jgi:hypothetical protein